MNKHITKSHHSIQLASAIFAGLLISLPTMLQSAQAQQQTVNRPGSKINPCPSIFYEEPHNNRVPVPQGCPANAFTNRINSSSSPSSTYNSNTGITNTEINPSSSQIQQGVGGEAPNSNSMTQSSTSQITVVPTNRYNNAVAAVSPTNGRVSILLINQTNAPIIYQAIGDTQQRILPGRSQITLQNLHTPANVNFYRQDRGLLMATPRSSRQGTLQLTLQETTDFAMDKTSLRIENNGAVYLN
ncbi:hypothetical protein [Calothrix sp. UHCC 0171]|uniref:hypothetical protein n=1 Tax=Calothrix sp. UHCC 0171 TaxID=3110245 RepID=UPI002B1FD9BD|nr:hypothetical protein [Calothrix sp. UHCC 0171]MEA5570757.1 hypothetical protein [Calothrix sp. UHCC 0171]